MSTHVLFVNSGILGMQSFSKFIREAMALDSEVDASHINLSEHLTINERVVRRVMCARFWPDGWLGLNNIDLARLRREYHAGVQASRRIRRIVATRQVDVLHFHRQATAYASLGLLKRVPSIVSIDCTQDAVINAATSKLEEWSYLPNAAIDGRIMSLAAAIVSTSRWAADCLRRRYPECKTPIHVMPPPVRMQFFDERWVEERSRRAVAGYLPRVLFVGGDFIRKGGEDLLAAWTIGELHRVARLDLVTDWSGNVSRIPGVRVLRDVSSYSSEWSELWRGADIFAMPTRNEAFGTVFQEAAAAGLPRVGTRLNAIPEIITDGQSGLLVEPGDRVALALTLRLLIESPALRRDLGRAARVGALVDAAPDRYRDRLSTIIQSVSGRSPIAARMLA